MKTKEEIQKGLSEASSALWHMRLELIEHRSAASVLVAEIVGAVSDQVDNCIELLNHIPIDDNPTK